MSDAVLVNPQEFDVDLHDVYAAFMGYFERKAIPWYKASYSAYFLTFNDFLSFGWQAIVVTDKRTGKGHVVVRGGGASSGGAGGGVSGNASGGSGDKANGQGVGAGNHDRGPVGVQGGSSYAMGGAVGQFAKMIKTRFGESLPKLPNQLPIEPFEHKPRIQRLVNDLGSYKRLAATVPAAQLHALKKKVRYGDVREVAALWSSRAYTFLALEVTWWEKGNGVVLEAGMCGCRCRNIDAMHAWPPIPDDNYRRSHYVVSDWLDKRTNTHHHMPSQPRSFAHGESQAVSMSMLTKILNASISSLSSPDTDTGPNTLVLVTCGDSSRLHDLKGVTIPSNVLVVDIAHLERALYRASLSEEARQSNSYRSAPLPLRDVLRHLDIPTPLQIPITNAGNSAFYTMTAFQILVDRHAQVPGILKPPVMAPDFRSQIYPRPQIYPSQGKQSSLAPRPDHPSKRGSVLPPSMRRAKTMFWDEPPQILDHRTPSDETPSFEKLNLG